MIRYICDVCGLTAPADALHTGELVLPENWLIRFDGKGERHLCSHECKKKILEKDDDKTLN